MFSFVYTCLCLACLSAGFYFGFKVGKTSEFPKIVVPNELRHPFKTARENMEQERQNDRLNRILSNIDNYDGSSLSQEDV